MKILFDVGANSGEDSIPFAKNNPDSLVYAFEPNPFMIDFLKEQSQGLENYHIIPVAVSNYEGTSSFNLCNEYKGLCSLLEFDEDARNKWPRFNLLIDEKIEVQVIKLENFIKEKNIKKIDYFHCDTQGSDLKVLEGLGEFIHLIEEGQVEATRLSDGLYKDQNNYIETIQFLASKGFETYQLDDQIHFDECNVKFKKYLFKTE